jgi:hypothetical protein
MASRPSATVGNAELELPSAGYPSATVNMAIQARHALPKQVLGELAAQLLEMPNVIEALGSCQRRLELDGADPVYHTDEWLPSVYDIARPLVQSAGSDTEPAILVQVTQDTVGWLSRAMRLRA